jgi:DNA protecting protein DprA
MSFAHYPIHELNLLPAALIPPDTPRGKRLTLYLRGSRGALGLLERLPQHGFGVVGTRRPQARALDFTRRVVTSLRESRIVILSGLALGIDAQAHEAALAANLPTIAFLGGGLETPIYPPRNHALALRILERGGLLVSEYPADFEPRPWSFVQRNRWIAAWSRATWIAQASDGSGALITGSWAQDYHRDLYCTPGFPGDPTMAGGERLLDVDGAIALWGPGSLGYTWSEFSHLGGRQPTQKDLPLSLAPPVLDSSAELLLGWIREEMTHGGGVRFERIVERALEASLSISDTQRAAQKLMTQGLIREVAGTLVTI